MCGIAAVFGRGGGDMTAFIREMTGAVRHRGPDGEGYVLFERGRAPEVLGGPDTPAETYGHALPYCPRREASKSGAYEVALGHRRLAIVDLSPAGHQPMCSPDGSLWITYNGEIYNHPELRAELESAGHRFASHCDTEVILAAYRQWGEGCLQRFNGMFAFVVVDWERRVAFAARDRFGVKPLYYWLAPNGMLAFASEIKQFTVLSGWRASVNAQRAYDFLNWGLFDHTRETLFGGVQQLRGGECLTFSLDLVPATPAPRAWYTLSPASRTLERSSPSAQYRALLEDSVRLRLRADVPVGSCLSGGLDSSSIVCIANRLLRESSAEALQNTFSARSSDPRYDEGRHIGAVVGAIGVRNVQVNPDPAELFEALPLMTWHQDEPFGSTSIFAQWNVFALAARHGVKVMLDGQGADEQLAGYHSFYSARFSSLLKHLRLVQLAGEMAAVRRAHGYPWGQLLAYATSFLLPEILRQRLRGVTGRASVQAPNWLDVERLGARAGDPFVDAGAKVTTVRELSSAQILQTSLPMLLHWEDRDAMAHSIEARVPFLDYRLVEFALGLPDEAKLSGGVTKRVLREAMRGTLPEEVRTRMDKVGFATAEESWLRGAQRQAFRDALRAACEASRGVLRPASLEMLEQMIDGRRPFSFVPWRMISFGAWMRRFDVGLHPSA
jgi:asparagine synthase (glutamine-hydrolysing)